MANQLPIDDRRAIQLEDEHNTIVDSQILPEGPSGIYLRFYSDSDEVNDLGEAVIEPNGHLDCLISSAVKCTFIVIFCRLFWP